MSIKDLCYKIYCDEFGEDAFSKILFDKCFNCCKYLLIDGEPVSILFLLPCDIKIENKIVSAKYVFAVTTAAEHRAKGYMSALINQLEDSELLFLKPSDAKLFNYYERFGFKTFEATRERVGDKSVILKNEFLSLAKSFPDEDEEKYIAMYRNCEDIDLNGLSFFYTLE